VTTTEEKVVGVTAAVAGPRLGYPNTCHAD